MKHSHIRQLFHEPPRSKDRNEFSPTKNGRISKFVSSEPCQEESEKVVLEAVACVKKSQEEAQKGRELLLDSCLSLFIVIYEQAFC